MTVRYDPFGQMNRRFDRTRRSVWGGVEANVTVGPTDDGYVVTADLPGFEKDDLDITFDDGVLAIDGETTVTSERGPMSHRRSRTVHERLTVPEAVAVEDLGASYHNGVLEITVPTAEDATDAHRIDIE